MVFHDSLSVGTLGNLSSKPENFPPHDIEQYDITSAHQELHLSKTTSRKFVKTDQPME
jgi:hypothetical protein